MATLRARPESLEIDPRRTAVIVVDMQNAFATRGGMFDIAGTMWLVYVLFLYGLKSIWLPWVWPTFNQIFLMMFLSAWLRRSNVLTGAQWIQTRFGADRGGTLAHLSVVLFALVNVIGLLAYAFKGIGKFAAGMLPWHFTTQTTGIFTDENIYAMVLMGLRVVKPSVGR